MSKIFIIVGLVVILGIGAFILQNGAEHAEVIVSDDGAFELTIPGGALPEGVDVGDIRITKVISEAGSATPLAAYKLMPDGLVFLKPARFEAEFAVPDGALPMGFTVNPTEKKVEAIPNYIATIDRKTGLATVVGEQRHFSYNLFVANSIFVFVRDPSDTHVGESVTVNASVSEQGSPVWFRPISEDFTLSYQREGDWAVRGWMEEFNNDLLSPKRIDDLPALQTMGLKGAVSVSGLFTCTKKGDTSINYGLHLTASVRTEWHGQTVTGVLGALLTPDEIEEWNADFIVRNGQFRCNPSPKEMIKAIEYGGTHIPTSALRVGEVHPPHADGQGCPAKHWHADAPVTGVSGEISSDPNPESCGFGTLDEKPVVEVER